MRKDTKFAYYVSKGNLYKCELKADGKSEIIYDSSETERFNMVAVTDDGIYITKYYIEEPPAEIIYDSINDNKLILYVSDDEKYAFEIKDGQLIFENDGVISALIETGTIFTFNEETAEENSMIGYKKITSEEAYEMMGELTDYILLDVRTDEEYNEGHIDGAILIPDYEITARAEDELPKKDATILIYCRSGRRSANVANELIELGYMNVYDFGGIIDWEYETVK